MAEVPCFCSLKSIISTADSNGNINYNSLVTGGDGVEFSSDMDLFTSLHLTNISVVGNVNDGMLKVQLVDYYDYKFETNYSGSAFKKLAIVANNVAEVSESMDSINNYFIYIDIMYVIEWFVEEWLYCYRYISLC